MGKLRRGGYIFVWWKGDHPPRHVHIYRDGKLVVKWDLDNQKVMNGEASKKSSNSSESLRRKDCYEDQVGEM
jgi:hypothetical protein